MARPVKGTPTPTNIYVLAKSFANSERISARVDATDHSHLQRCINAGLACVEDGQLVLTDPGRLTVKNYNAAQAARK